MKNVKLHVSSLLVATVAMLAGCAVEDDIAGQVIEADQELLVDEELLAEPDVFADSDEPGDLPVAAGGGCGDLASAAIDAELATELEDGLSVFAAPKTIPRCPTNCRHCSIDGPITPGPHMCVYVIRDKDECAFASPLPGTAFKPPPRADWCWGSVWLERGLSTNVQWARNVDNKKEEFKISNGRIVHRIGSGAWKGLNSPPNIKKFFVAGTHHSSKGTAISLVAQDKNGVQWGTHQTTVSGTWAPWYIRFHPGK